MSSRKLAFFIAVAFAIYLVIALLLLRQYHSAHPWSRLDLFSGGSLLMGVVLGTLQVTTMARLFRARDITRHFEGEQFDPSFTMWTNILGTLELAAYADYGHWRIAPFLENVVAQSVGLALFVATAIWMWWVDRYLGSNFERAMRTHTLMTGGPYRLVRHPRYAALIMSRTAFALMIASAVGWIIWCLWVWFVARRILREEAYLQSEFGAEYSSYANGRSRLIPKFL